MTPELHRALRASPRLQKQIRQRHADLLRAVADGKTDEILEAARLWAEAEKAAADDLAKKEREPPKHRVTFLIEEGHYNEFCSTGAEYKISPSEVARRYCISGITFSHVLWSAMRNGKLSDVIVTTPGRGFNLAQIALPHFERGS
jgi:hypothetical protein